jgi:hypothetical protein
MIYPQFVNRSFYQNFPLYFYDAQKDVDKRRESPVKLCTSITLSFFADQKFRFPQWKKSFRHIKGGDPSDQQLIHRI